MIRQVWLGESGGVGRYSAERLVTPRTHSVAGSPAPNGVSYDYRPPRGKKEDDTSRHQWSRINIDTPPPASEP